MRTAMEALMRALLLCAFSGAALLVTAWFAGNSQPIPFATQTAVDFFVSACKGSADDLAAVAEVAERQSWTSILAPDSHDDGPLKVTGMWRANQDGQSYIVSTGFGPGTSTACQVMFDDPKPRRDDFLRAASSVMTLRAEIDQGSSWRTEIYQIENLAPKSVTLLFVSSPDGSVYHASVMGRP
jgi:hypothetical protein